MRHEIRKRIYSVINDIPYLKANINTIKTKTVKERMQHYITVFDSVWETADEKTRILVDLHFWKGKDYKDIIYPYSVTTMKRIIKAFVIRLGEALGEI